jgi:hypothetical protein
MIVDFSNNYKLPVKFLNNSVPSYIRLSYDQIKAVQDRNLHNCLKLGLTKDQYMSLIDPDYPPIIYGICG